MLSIQMGGAAKPFNRVTLLERIFEKLGNWA